MLPILAEDRLIGTRIEKCVVERLIGRGGYGLTFLAFDEELQEHRVLKVSNAWAEDEAGKRRQEKSFIEEGLILSRLKHPQIVTLRGQGERHGHRYMVLDYIQGFSLKSALDIVAARRAEIGCRWEDLLDPLTATALVLSALHPLEYAHRANVHLPDREIFGVAHRDISPGNLILGVKGNEKGKVILIDFGTAKTDLADTTTVNQHLVGTVPYMSKARLQKAADPGQDADHHSFWRSYRETQNDIHALGVLYYQLLTGKLPFPGETTPQIIVRVLDPGSYSAFHREMAANFPYLAGVLRKCLVYFDFSAPLDEQPYQYPDAGAMRKELEGVYAGMANGRSVQDILLAFSAKLSEPTGFTGRVTRIGPSPAHAESAEFAIPDPPAAYRGDFSDLAGPSRRNATLSLVSGLALGLALLAGVFWWIRKEKAETLAGLSPAPSSLESLDFDDPPFAPGGGDRARNVSEPTRKGGRPKAGVKSKPGPRSSAASGPGSGVSGTAPSQVAGATAAEPAPGDMSVAGLIEMATGKAAEALSSAESNQAWSKEVFVQLQTLVREGDPSAFDRIADWLGRAPDSPDLLLLKCELILQRNPTSAEARAILAGLHTTRPAFLHPKLFQENVLYRLWEADAAIYEAQKTPAARINLLKTANAYLSAYQPNPAYSAKVADIRAKLPGNSGETSR
jgi:serine/threonine protein kinase